MKQILLRFALCILEGTIALIAISNSLAVLTSGPVALRMPLELAWLQNTPFSDYTIPMLLLAIVIGGSSLLAAALVFVNREWSVLLSAAAGLVTAGYVTVELTILQRVYGLEVVLFVIGATIFGLAAYLWRVEYRRHLVQVRHVNHA
jgi:hypothetical protein